MRVNGWIVGAIALALSGCSGISVSSDWDPGVDFASFQTFTVLDEAEGGQTNDLVRGRVINAIVATMENKGWRHVDNADDADAAVGWQFTTDERSSFSTVSSGWGGYGYRWGRWYGPSMTTTTARTTETRYQVGTLIIAIFDTASEEMIFTSTGSKTLDEGNRTPEEIEKRVNDAVQQILKDFPPGAE